MDAASYSFGDAEGDGEGVCCAEGVAEETELFDGEGLAYFQDIISSSEHSLWGTIPAQAKTFFGDGLISSLRPIPGRSGVIIRKPNDDAISS